MNSGDAVRGAKGHAEDASAKLNVFQRLQRKPAVRIATKLATGYATQNLYTVDSGLAELSFVARSSNHASVRRIADYVDLVSSHTVRRLI